jgi:hypothetical protein
MSAKPESLHVVEVKKQREERCRSRRPLVARHESRLPCGGSPSYLSRHGCRVWRSGGYRDVFGSSSCKWSGGAVSGSDIGGDGDGSSGSTVEPSEPSARVARGQKRRMQIAQARPTCHDPKAGCAGERGQECRSLIQALTLKF